MLNFKQFITEMPEMNSFLSKERVRDGSKDIDKVLAQTKEETHLGNGIFTKKIGNIAYYYNKNHDNSTKDFSVVTDDNVHKLTRKGGTRQHQIHDFMIHHATNHGLVRSDDSNTEGSKKLWIELIKKKPKNMSFHVQSPSGNFSVDHTNIDDHADKIWGLGRHYKAVRLEMRHDDKK